MPSDADKLREIVSSYAKAFDGCDTMDEAASVVSCMCDDLYAFADDTPQPVSGGVRAAARAVTDGAHRNANDTTEWCEVAPELIDDLAAALASSPNPETAAPTGTIFELDMFRERLEKWADQMVEADENNRIENRVGVMITASSIMAGRIRKRAAELKTLIDNVQAQYCPSETAGESVVIEGELGWDGALGHTIDGAEIERLIEERFGSGVKAAPGRYVIGPVRLTIQSTQGEADHG